MNRFKLRCIGGLLGASLLMGLSGPAVALVIDPATVNLFRDFRGTNDVGAGSGNFWQFGANIVGGSAGAKLSATSPDGTFTTGLSTCGPLATNANFCATSMAVNANRSGAWTLNFSRPNDTPASVLAPTTVGTELNVPFPNNVSISGNGVTPTISWQLPVGFTPNGFRINIYDKSHILANGAADVVYTANMASNATSLVLPADLGGGRSLSVGGNYSVGFQVIETRDNQAFGGNNAQILSRSSSFFAFSPQAAGSSGPPNAFLPQVIPDTNPNDNKGPVYTFSITNVGPNSVTFIDPVVAVGYDYAIAAGDPNFASVTLPSVGDGLFDLSYLFNGSTIHQLLAAGVQFFFPQGGVDAFSVRGIETSAGLDPANGGAFITGLTFVRVGNFNGTMTAIVADVPVPLPATALLMLAGIVGVGATRRRGQRR